MEKKYDWKEYKLDRTYKPNDEPYKFIFRNDNFFFIFEIKDYDEVRRLDPKGNKLCSGKSGFLSENISKLSIEKINENFFEFDESYRDVNEYEYFGKDANFEKEKAKVFFKRKGKVTKNYGFLFQYFYRHKKHPQIIVSYCSYEHDCEKELKEALDNLCPSHFAIQFFGFLTS